MAAAVDELEVEAVRARTEALYRQYGLYVSRMCRALLRDRADAEDATQQVFLSVHRALLGGVAPREPAAWLATIARRECWARSAAYAAAPAHAVPVAARDVADDVLRRAEVAALWLAIGELPAAQRRALLLREIRGLSYLQLGRELALSASATRSLLARARQRLRARLRDIHTALGGVPLLDTLVRLGSGGVNTAAPARVAALGLGAAAVAGGAIVAPSALEHHVRRPATAVAVARPPAGGRVLRTVAPAAAPIHGVGFVHAAPSREISNLVRTAQVQPRVDRPRRPSHEPTPSGAEHETTPTAGATRSDGERASSRESSSGGPAGPPDGTNVTPSGDDGGATDGSAVAAAPVVAPVQQTDDGGSAPGSSTFSGNRGTHVSGSDGGSGDGGGGATSGSDGSHDGTGGDGSAATFSSQTPLYH